MKLNINGKSFELSDEELKKALDEKKESFEVKSEDFVIRTTEEDSSYSENMRKEGISAGAEIGRKEVLKGLSIEGEGLHKSDAKSIEAINGLISSRVQKGLEDANIEPDKKILELQKDKEEMTATIQSLQGDLSDKDNEFQSFKSDLKRKEAIKKVIPDNIIIPKDSMLQLIMNDQRTAINENGVVYGIGADGEPLKDPTTRNLLPIDKVVNSYFDSNPHFLKKSSGGNGGNGGTDPNGKQSIESFIKEMGEQGVKPNSEEFNRIMGERIKAGSLEA